jgi:hypothetical protein
LFIAFSQQQQQQQQQHPYHHITVGKSRLSESSKLQNARRQEGEWWVRKYFVARGAIHRVKRSMICVHAASPLEGAKP